jgi:hypothetical protein
MDFAMAQVNVNQNSRQDTVDELFGESLRIGYRFLPTDEELVYHYLIKKVLGQPLPSNRIHVDDLYKYHPQDLTSKYLHSFQLY